MNKLNKLMAEKTIFLNYMKEKYKVYYNSNIFLRDIQYAIKSFLEKKDYKVTYAEAETLMKDFTANLENSGELIKLNDNTWKVNFSFDEPVLEIESKDVPETKQV